MVPSQVCSDARSAYHRREYHVNWSAVIAERCAHADATGWLVSQPRNHYQNLKVARNASVKEIEAAYRALVWKYHPDRSADPGAARVIRIVNAAYEVLSDPVKRKRHDAWIESNKIEWQTYETRPHRDHSMIMAVHSSIATRLAKVRRVVSNNGPYKLGIALVAAVVAIVAVWKALG